MDWAARADAADAEERAAAGQDAASPLFAPGAGGAGRGVRAAPARSGPTPRSSDEIHGALDRDVHGAAAVRSIQP